LKLAHKTWVIVADGEKFLLLNNKGDQDFLNLEVVKAETNRTPPDHELSADRPGRQNDAARQVTGGVEAWGKSAMEETDWHRVAEERFAKETTAKLREWAASGRFGQLVVIADPRTLGEMRAAYDDGLRSVIIAEINKDLTKMPLDKIEKSILAYETV